MSVETNVYVSENFTVMTSDMLDQHQNQEENGAVNFSPKSLRSVNLGNVDMGLS